MPSHPSAKHVRLKVWHRLRRRAVRLVGDTEADDLLQETFLAAVHAGRKPLVAESDLRWAFGTMCNLAKMSARERRRRRRREQAVAVEAVDVEISQNSPTAMELDLARRWLNALPKAQAQIIYLLLAGLTRAEIRMALSLTDVALRQRLTALRSSLRTLPAPLEGEVMAAAVRQSPDSDLELGLMRRVLKAELLRTGGVGTHDPDGHLLVIRRSKAHKTALGGNLCMESPFSRNQE